MSKKEYMITEVESSWTGKVGSLFLSSGGINEYRRAFLNGTAASRSDDTFDPKMGVHGGHKCCGSLAWYRHKNNCKHISRLEDIAGKPWDKYPPDGVLKERARREVLRKRRMELESHPDKTFKRIRSKIIQCKKCEHWMWSKQWKCVFCQIIK